MLHKEYSIVKDDYAHAGEVSSAIKQTLSQLSIPTTVLRRIAVACYEAEINMIIHSDGGVITLDVSDEGKVELSFKDVGPGIPDVDKACSPGYSTASEEARSLGFGAGMGLPNIKRVSDHFSIDTSPKGTTLTVAFEAQHE